MTVQGAINKSLILGGIMLLTGSHQFSMPSQLFLLGRRHRRADRSRHRFHEAADVANPGARLRAGLEGLFVGPSPPFYASMFNGIIFQAVTLTMAVFFLMLFFYKSGIIKATGKLRTGIIIPRHRAIFVFYLLNWIPSMFGVNMPLFTSGRLDEHRYQPGDRWRGFP